MGMILGFFLLVYVAVAVGIYIFIKNYIGMKWVNRITLAILILIPTYDIIITNVLGVYYCNAEPNPKTFIKNKVEYPISIYWTSSIGLGLDENAREAMIINYLDGVHLKTMALNGKDGKVYLYKATLKDWENSRKIAKKEEANSSLKYKNKDGTKVTSYSQAYYDARDENARKIVDRGMIYDKYKIPQMNYTVTFDEVELNPFVRKFLYSDEIKVIDNKTNEVIAYNRRYMHFFYNISMGLGGDGYSPDPICGFRFTRHFDAMIFPSLKYLYFGEVEK